MKIGLINLEPKIVNTALMQISQYHKQRGDSVAWWSPLEHRQFDHVYCSSLFDYTPKNHIPDDVITGGTGYDLDSRLSKVIEDCDYDYSLYPECDYSIVWFSRGCIRKCPFCAVWKKEGKIHEAKPKLLNPNGKYIKIQDNNFFANKDYIFALMQLREYGLPVEFSSGIDIRLMDNRQAQLLSNMKIQGQIHTAWDNPKDDLISKFKILLKHVKSYKVMCYVLIGYWSTPEQDLYRIEKLRELKIDPFVMPYNKKDPYQKRFARWVNHKAIFKTVAWKDYGKSIEKEPVQGLF